MKKGRSDTAESRLFLHDILFRADCILLLSVTVTIWLICGMFAKYAVTDEGSDSARAAAFASIDVTEHRAELKNGEYRLTDDEVKENSYNKVIPGVDIPKDPVVHLSGTPEVACMLYLKVTEDNFPTYVKTIPTVTYQRNDSLIYNEEFDRWQYTDILMPEPLYFDTDTVTFELTSDWSIDEELSDPSGTDFYCKYADHTINEPAAGGSTDKTLKAVNYELTEDWTYVKELSDDGKGIGVYKYKSELSPGATIEDIPILKQIGDTIGDRQCELTVSEKYVGEFDTDGEPVPFTLTFSVWLVQSD